MFYKKETILSTASFLALAGTIFWIIQNQIGSMNWTIGRVLIACAIIQYVGLKSLGFDGWLGLRGDFLEFGEIIEFDDTPFFGNSLIALLISTSIAGICLLVALTANGVQESIKVTFFFAFKSFWARTIFSLSAGFAVNTLLRMIIYAGIDNRKAYWANCHECDDCLWHKGNDNDGGNCRKNNNLPSHQSTQMIKGKRNNEALPGRATQKLIGNQTRTALPKHKESLLLPQKPGKN